MIEKSNIIFSLVPGIWFIALFIAESVFSLRRPVRNRFHRITVNLIFSSIAAVTGLLAVRPVSMGTVLFSGNNGIGLLNIFDFPFSIEFTIGFLLMDLSFYYWHRLNHVVPLLWRFHNVHHSDPDLDVSTSFRFHFVEILYSSIFRIVQVAIIGIPIHVYLCYELVFSLATIFHHSNIRLPLRVEKLLNKIVVTPRMHGVHHSFYRDETNSNYSVIFSFWDRLHRSLILNVPQSEIRIGVPAYNRTKDNTLSHMIRMPFFAQREYWETEGTSFETRMYGDTVVNIGDMSE